MGIVFLLDISMGDNFVSAVQQASTAVLLTARRLQCYTLVTFFDDAPSHWNVKYQRDFVHVDYVAYTDIMILDFVLHKCWKVLKFFS